MKKAFKNLQALCKEQKEPSNVAVLAVLVEENDFGYHVSTNAFGTEEQRVAAIASLIEDYPDTVAKAICFLELQKQIKN